MEERNEVNMNVTENEETNVVVSANSESNTGSGAGAALAALGLLATAGYVAGKGIEWGVKKLAPKVKNLFKKKDDAIDVESKEVTEEENSDSEESTK